MVAIARVAGAPTAVAAEDDMPRWASEEGVDPFWSRCGTCAKCAIWPCNCHEDHEDFFLIRRIDMIYIDLWHLGDDITTEDSHSTFSIFERCDED